MTQEAQGLAYKLHKITNKAYNVLLIFLYQWHTSNAPKHVLKSLSNLVFMPYMTEIVMPLIDMLSYMPYDEHAMMGAGFELDESLFDISDDPESIQKSQTAHIEQIIEEAKEIAEYTKNNAADKGLF